MTVLEGLPDAVFALSPPLAGAALPDEPRSSCASCAMAPERVPAGRPAFAAAARCCTYHPDLTNVSVGRALRRGGAGAAKVLARLADPEGVGPYGVRAPSSWRAAYAERPAQAFGNDAALTCPYWQAGPAGCTIHLDRDAVCRTWFCRLSEGERGAAAWRALRRWLTALEDLLAAAVVDAPSDAPAPDAGADAWAAWYVACADRADALEPARLAALRRPGVVSREEAFAAARNGLGRPLPAVVAPSLRSWHPEGAGWVMAGWSAYDLTETPGWIFRFLAKLDGRTPWRDAAAATAAEVGEPVEEGFVTLLWQRGLLSEPTDLDVQPGVTVRVTGLPELPAGERWAIEGAGGVTAGTWSGRG